jgi:hypothetical protein
VQGARSEAVKLGSIRTTFEFMFKGQELHEVVRQVQELREAVEELKRGQEVRAGAVKHPKAG